MIPAQINKMNNPKLPLETLRSRYEKPFSGCN